MKYEFEMKFQIFKYVVFCGQWDECRVEVKTTTSLERIGDFLIMWNMCTVHNCT